ncbi:MAG: DUF2059 domain-containing protein [Terricaulis sp.]
MKRMFAGAALLAVLFAYPSLAQQAPAPNASAASPAATANIDPERLALARRVIEDNGTRANEQALIAQMMPQMCQTIGRAQGLNDQQIAMVTNVVMDEMNSSVDDLVEIAVRIYANHFSADQLRTMAAFYESPAGRAYIAEMPSLMHDSMTLAQQWAQTTGAPRVAARIAAAMAQQQQQQHP